ncbi:hypothetical protein [Streptomyces roseirectus]|uniref:hypothetical protein n=1 Tax=Streptomyces roseirectus TaxID=2768066 RepID=UPI001CA69131|nr:hypothetical protein [Streptomyces roseirectus]
MEASFAGRGGRLDEITTLRRTAWDEERTPSFDGRYRQADGLDWLPRRPAPVARG